ncbi:MAG TPA: hypothetical protein VMY39_03990 [Planctomycetota bacterium]|nr:hypothetical protein [Planctomycetota bacterium]
MDAHEIADALHREADEILYRRGVDAILQSFGRVHYTGSYALNLMAWPDIDITMVLDGDPYSFDNFFEMGKQLAAVEGVDKIEYWNSLNWDVANLPKGLYWGVRCKTATREVPWKIDVWATNEAEFRSNQQLMKRLAGEITDEARKLIVEVKHAMLTPEGRTPQGSGYYIYEAVLFKGLRAARDIREYLKQHGINL